MFGVGKGLKWGLLIGGAGSRAADGCAVLTSSGLPPTQGVLDSVILGSGGRGAGVEDCCILVHRSDSSLASELPEAVDGREW